MSNKPKLLILGHGRHGKDTLAEILADNSDLAFSSSSRAAAEVFLFDKMKDEFGYNSVDECFEDRHNHREYWYRSIQEFNSEDRARLCKEILKINDMYVGMRCHKEYLATNHLFDMILLVDAGKRVDYVDPTFNIPVYGNQRLIYNHMGLDFLEFQALEILDELKSRGFDVGKR